MIKIVIIEDDQIWINLLEDELPEKIDDCKVYGILFVMENYEEIIEQIRQIDPDIAILDINMGNNPKSGIKLANRINKVMPTLDYIFLSSQKSEDPFILKEASYTKAKVFLDKNDFKNDLDSLANYIKNNIKNKIENLGILNLNPMIINFDARTVYLNDIEIHFTKMEFEILSYMAKNKNRVFSKVQLYRFATDENVQEDTFENTVVSHIKSIRDKFKKIDKNFNPIKTVQSYGYKYDQS
tara:strand:+ start:4134 stop:4853 length:720 start_codon:yes stop_codon:yes gene_type:complete